MVSNRRQFLRILTFSGITALAGCSGSDTNDGTGNLFSQQTATSTSTQSSESTPTPATDQIPSDVITESAHISPTADDVEQFGLSIAISRDGSTALIGALSPSRGYIFERSGGSWQQQTTLDIDLGGEPYFVSVGISVDGETAVVGGFGRRGSGRAIAFERAGGAWDKAANLDPRVAVRDGLGRFGRQIAVSRNGRKIAVEGVFNPGGGEGARGTVFMFTKHRSRWNRSARLTPSRFARGFAVAVSSDGSTALLGSSTETVTTDSSERSGESTGAAYVMTAADGGWTRQSRLVASDGNSEDFFGSGVALSGDGSTALISSAGDEDPNGTDSGSAYVFSKNDTWEEEAKLVPDDGDEFDQFGNMVSLSHDGTTALIGAVTDEGPNGATSEERSGAGSAYLFTRTGGTWEQHAKVAASDGNPEDYFGVSGSIAASGSPVLIGASGDEDSEADRTGSVYSFTTL